MSSPDRRPGLGEVIVEKARSAIDTVVFSLRSIEDNKLQVLRARLSQAPDNQLITRLRRFRLDEGLIMGGYLLGWGGFELILVKALSEENGGNNIWGVACYGEIMLNTLITTGLMMMVDRRENILFEEANRRTGLEVRRGGWSRWADRIVPRQLAA